MSTSEPRKNPSRIAVTCALAIVMSATASMAASTSPGKNSAFESSSALLVGPGSTLLTASLEKGKKKTVLAIEASYTDAAYSPTAATARVLGLTVTVNGLGVQPNPVAPYTVNTDCGFTDTPPAACTVTGTWWLDIDAAETASPGLFVGQPLSIALVGGDLSLGALVGVQPMDASLSVRVTKK